MKEKERIILFVGHYGSGKTEIALNYALKSAMEGRKTVIVDIDIVNPFFRTAEVRDKLEEKGIKVISPNYAATTMDIPSLPPDVISVFQDKEARVVFDVGGDDTGATVLGRYNPYFKEEDYRMFYVVNTMRPMSSNEQEIQDMLKEIERHSRLKVTDLINNTNLSYESTSEDIIKGQGIVGNVGHKLNIPLTYVSGETNILDSLPEDMQAYRFDIELFMKPSWLA